MVLSTLQELWFAFCLDMVNISNGWFCSNVIDFMEVLVNVLPMEMDQTLERKSQLYQLDHWQRVKATYYCNGSAV